MIDWGAAWCNQLLDLNLKTFKVMKCCLFYVWLSLNTTYQAFLSLNRIKRVYSSSWMKNRKVKCFFKEKRPDFLSSGGGNHLDQSVLWHRDVIELLMPLNEITCDLVAGSFHERCHSIVSKTPLSSQNGKHSLRFNVQNAEGEKAATTSRKSE